MATAASAWKPAYSVKIASLDQQHQKLFSIIDQLQHALEMAKGQSVVKSVLDQLVSYTIQHFQAEEALLEKQGYPALPSHRAQHKALVDKVLNFQKEYAEGKHGVAPQLMMFLQTWLRDHIMKTDMQYSDFLQSKGVR